MEFLSCSLLLTLVYTAAAYTEIPGAHPLYHALHHFEVLHKDHLNHSSLPERSLKQLNFNTLGREFRLLLRPRRSPLHGELQAIVIREGGIREVVTVNPDHHLTGRLADDPHSTVHAHYDHTQGILSASIVTKTDRYFIEPSYRHISQPHDFHMISYRGSDVKYNLTGDPNHHFCGTQSPYHNHPINSQDNTLTLSKTQSVQERLNDGGRERLKRQVGARGRLLCPLSLVATFKFHRVFSTGGDVGNSINFIISVVDMAESQIFSTSQWNMDIGERGFLFRNITIHTASTNDPAYNSDPQGGWFSEELLRVFSNQDWGSFCLAHLFTAESFTDSRLGVAYIASSRLNVNGGICSRRFQNPGQSPVTQNVGVSSFVQGSRPLLLPEAMLVVAHELGHNWGSDHDPTGGITLCNPGLNEGGKFLMFPSSTSGQQENNRRFSPCSVTMISEVLRAKSSCFVEESPERCGDFMVDDGEDCDAGPDGLLGLDPCCDENCHLRSMAMCSDINEVCCSDCNFADSSVLCETFPANSDTCRQNLTCTGTNGSCPAVQNYVNVGTRCQGSGLCLREDTVCNNSLPCVSAPVTSSFEPLKCFNLCEQQNKTQCFCEPLSENECKLCCRDQDRNSSCMPLEDEELLVDGSTCLGGQCQAGVCVPVTQDLATRLFNLFATININTFLQFLRENIVGSVLFFATIVWIPPSLIISIIDKRKWNEFSEAADIQEQKQYLLKLEDDIDRNQIDTIHLTHSNADIDAFTAKKALLRQHSIAESIYDGSLVHPGHFYFPSAQENPFDPSARPGYQTLQSIPEEGPDPATDNIQAFKMSGEVKGHPIATKDHPDTLYTKQSNIYSLNSRSTIV